MLFGKKTPYTLPEGWRDSIALRQSPRARRLSLTLDPKSGGIVLVLPKRFSHAVADHFLLQNRDWIERQEKTRPAHIALVPGAVIPLRGTPHVLQPFPDRRRRGPPEIRDGVICIAGDPAHFARRARDFLIETARQELDRRTRDKAAILGRSVKSLRLGDPRSRWGSCHPDGRISYSWRLILAPDHVLDYVVAHEVAHLLHRGHQRDFWACCESLCPGAREARRWLKQNGRGLLSIGV